MKHITSLWLLVFFMASASLIAQNDVTEMVSKKAASAMCKTGQQPNLNVEVKAGVLSQNDQIGRASCRERV